MIELMVALFANVFVCRHNSFVPTFKGAKLLKHFTLARQASQGGDTPVEYHGSIVHIGIFDIAL